MHECRQTIKNHMVHVHWLAIQLARDVIDAVLRPQGMLLQELLLLVFGQANRQEAAHLLGL